MARNPIVRNTILSVLSNAERPIQISEVITRSAVSLGRPSIDRKSISQALKGLIRTNLVEAELSNGKTVYSLTTRYYENTLRSTLHKLIVKGVASDIGKTIDNGMTNRNLPYIIHVIPPDEEFTEVADKAGLGFEVSWESPARGISTILTNDILCLDDSKREGVTKLLEWGYWTGVRRYIEDFAGGFFERPLQETIRELKTFTKHAIVNAAKARDTDRESTERALLEILKITEELVQKDNLEDFLNFGFEKRSEIKGLQGIILSASGNYTNGGERMFDKLIYDMGERFFLGLEEVKQRASLQQIVPEHMLAAFSVWNDLMINILGLKLERGELKNVCGDLTKARAKLIEYSAYIESLANVVKGRNISALYLWGFPEIDEEAEKQYRFSHFDDWLDALKTGQLDHRVWLFTEKTNKRLRKAYHSVRGGRPPLPVKIDKEFWTLEDIYKYHPQGKDPGFWLDLLEALRDRSSEENESHRKAAVPPGIYSEFKKKESKFVNEMLDEAEKEALGSKRKRTDRE